MSPKPAFTQSGHDPRDSWIAPTLADTSAHASDWGPSCVVASGFKVLLARCTQIQNRPTLQVNEVGLRGCCSSCLRSLLELAVQIRGFEVLLQRRFGDLRGSRSLVLKDQEINRACQSAARRSAGLEMGDMQEKHEHHAMANSDPYAH